jgi:hypothetical protein
LSLAVITVIVGLLTLFLAAVHAIPSTPVSGPRGGGQVIVDNSPSANYSDYSVPAPEPTQPSWMRPTR